MKIARPAPRPQRESTIPLINVVFLMLIFFLVAGTLAPPTDRDVTLAASRDAAGARPSETLMIAADGSPSWRGAPVALAPFAASWTSPDGEPLRVGADRTLPARALIDALAALRAAGIEDIVLVTEQAGP
ncbi:ExbD/TolR family protein [Pelagibacterium montanilacus]|uniref:ExbD/TolR family protein n=1 Tax=Pelagibacterium montanilacus TaxID=2185280 RepID=UPI000F8E9729|nr:biopolymer transporter ExbD [Pelagibacterium montanilacus]